MLLRDAGSNLLGTLLLIFFSNFAQLSYYSFGLFLFCLVLEPRSTPSSLFSSSASPHTQKQETLFCSWPLPLLLLSLTGSPVTYYSSPHQQTTATVAGGRQLLPPQPLHSAPLAHHHSHKLFKISKVNLKFQIF